MTQVALEWFKRAVEKGSMQARFRVGLAYEQGTILCLLSIMPNTFGGCVIGKAVERDMKVALEWYRQSAEQGNNYTPPEPCCSCHPSYHMVLVLGVLNWSLPNQSNK
jgi:TPR repeat protein